MAARYSATLLVVDADRLAHRGEHPGRRHRAICHHRADGRRPGVAARSAVEGDGHDGDTVERVTGGVRTVVEEGHGTRMHPQLSHDASDPSGARLMRSASVDGIVRWHPWQVVPTRRAMPAPLRRGTACS